MNILEEINSSTCTQVRHNVGHWHSSVTMTSSLLSNQTVSYVLQDFFFICGKAGQKSKMQHKLNFHCSYFITLEILFKTAPEHVCFCIKSLKLLGKPQLLTRETYPYISHSSSGHHTNYHKLNVSSLIQMRQSIILQLLLIIFFIFLPGYNVQLQIT